jgi:hypothetical protein
VITQHDHGDTEIDGNSGPTLGALGGPYVQGTALLPGVLGEEGSTFSRGL